MPSIRNPGRRTLRVSTNPPERPVVAGEILSLLHHGGRMGEDSRTLPFCVAIDIELTALQIAARTGSREVSACRIVIPPPEIAGAQYGGRAGFDLPPGQLDTTLTAGARRFPAFRPINVMPAGIWYVRPHTCSRSTSWQMRCRLQRREQQACRVPEFSVPAARPGSSCREHRRLENGSVARVVGGRFRSRPHPSSKLSLRPPMSLSSNNRRRRPRRKPPPRRISPCGL